MNETAQKTLEEARATARVEVNYRDEELGKANAKARECLERLEAARLRLADYDEAMSEILALA